MISGLFPFKGRTLDPALPVRVFRNRTGRGQTWSIVQSGLVVAHADMFGLRDARMVVHEKSRQRFLRTGKNNAHAYIEGTYDDSYAVDDGWSRVTYLPRGEAGKFLRSGGTPILCAVGVSFYGREVRAWGWDNL